MYHSIDQNILECHPQVLFLNQCYQSLLFVILFSNHSSISFPLSLSLPVYFILLCCPSHSIFVTLLIPFDLLHLLITIWNPSFCQSVFVNHPPINSHCQLLKSYSAYNSCCFPFFELCCFGEKRTCPTPSSCFHGLACIYIQPLLFSLSS